MAPAQAPPPQPPVIVRPREEYPDYDEKDIRHPSNEAATDALRSSGDFSFSASVSQVAIERMLSRVYGTGADANSTFLSRILLDATVADHPGLAGFGVETCLQSIRTDLCLKVQEVASLLGVERQTVYAWQKGENEPRPDALQRLRELDRIAKEWLSLADGMAMGSRVRTATTKDGRSVVDLLGEERIDQQELSALLRGIAEEVKQKARRRDRVAEPPGNSQAFIEAMAGKRFTED